VDSPLFIGPDSLRDPRERFAFWATALLALPAALLIGYVLHESIGASQVALFIVIAMVYVTLARGRLLGTSVRVHETQYPRVFSMVKSACAALEIPLPLVFVREDNYVPVAALGFGEPYSLVLSSHWIEVFDDDELAFMIGRELGHIAAGHTRFLSLLSVNGKENPIVAMIFGAWLRRCAATCDKFGLLCCGDLDAAIRAIGVAEFHEFGRKVDYHAFAEQYAELQADSVSRWGVWLGAEPYATTRLASLRSFISTPLYDAAREWFVRERDEEPPVLAAPGVMTVAKRDCAGWWRRCAAFAIDIVLVLAIINSFVGNGGGSPVVVNVNDDDSKPAVTASHNKNKQPKPEPTASPQPIHWGPFTMIPQQNVEFKLGPLTISPKTVDPNNNSGKTFWFVVYMALLVSVAGQTFGMMIAGLRVVTKDFGRPRIWQTIFRYTIVFFLWWLIVPASFFARHIFLHDRWTKTRLVKVERVVARATGST
jgi:Zn-dependent protease with chaperone function